ncbi:isocitrate/isopropylmalate family dehydrogenase [Ferroplasma sp. Type II]|uniref:isocitrate/isopropylmalate family dehydrogenase n=1 Tax=Ferroplasma sp. Type II TaxID=261388 RepID=UPI0025BA7580|nr:isocitrate/isopropylmalate family dehydrogenase [Ferroplasma sp. Type II]
MLKCMVELMYIEFTDAGMVVPDTLTIGYIDGDGIGPEITKAMIDVVNSAIELAYGGNKSIEWHRILIGSEAYDKFGTYIPEDSIKEIQKMSVVMKSTLNLMPDNRDINTVLRRRLGLYSNIRMLKYIPGMDVRINTFNRLNLTIVRDSLPNTHIFYHSSESTDDLIKFISDNYDLNITPDSEIYMITQSKFRTRKIAKQAIQYSKRKGNGKITIVESQQNPEFAQWCLEELSKHEDINYEIMKTRQFMQKIIISPENFEVILLDNILSRTLVDYLMGAINTEYGCSMGDECAVFEAVQSSLPSEAGYDAADPLSFILSGCAMLRHIGWDEATKIIENAISAAFMDNKIPKDITSRTDINPIKCSEFSLEIIKRMDGI